LLRIRVALSDISVYVMLRFAIAGPFEWCRVMARTIPTISNATKVGR
jgi:hypothetical protein